MKRAFGFVVCLLLIGICIFPILIGDTFDIYQTNIHCSYDNSKSMVENNENGSLSGFVNDSDSKPIMGATVSISCGDTLFMQNITDATGFYVIENVPLVDCFWNVNASKSGYTSSWFEMSIDPNSTHDFSLMPLFDVYVDDDADASWYDATHVRTVQEGIGNATSNNTVFVYDGTYLESVNIDKSIQLIGNNKDTTTINGYIPGYSSINVYCNNVSIKEFTITLSYGDIGIRAHNLPSIKNLSISDCIFHDTGEAGIDLTMCNNSIITNCSISNTGSGIQLDRSGQTIIRNCTIYGNSFGIYLYQSDHTTIKNNTIRDHSEDGIRCQESYNGVFYHNNFMRNSPHAIDDGMNSWDNGYLSGGNYWDDYDGNDANEDGIGDTPYNVSGGSNQDLYPLMDPWGAVLPDLVYIDDDYTSATPGWQYDHFDVIQDGIDAVAEQGTVYVFSGMYYETIEINKTINLVGENRVDTIIDGGWCINTVHIAVDKVHFTNFTVLNGFYGLFISSNDNTISGNAIDSTYSINTSYTHNNLIYNNVFNSTYNYVDNGTNIWNISKTAGTNVIGGPYLGGNYWSDYYGVDSDGDGLGDTEIPYGPGDYLPLTNLHPINLNQSVFDRGFPIRHTLDGDWGAAQSFMPTLNTFTGAEMYLRKFGTPEFNMTVELRENHPQGTLVDTLTFTPDEVGEAFSWFSLDFTDTPTTPEVQYFIVSPPAPSDITTSFGYEWGYAFGDLYPDGAFWFTRNSGALWRDLPTMYEFCFRTYGY